jgi:hypothetical protein
MAGLSLSGNGCCYALHISIGSIVIVVIAIAVAVAVLYALVYAKNTLQADVDSLLGYSTM